MTDYIGAMGMEGIRTTLPIEQDFSQTTRALSILGLVIIISIHVIVLLIRYVANYRLVHTELMKIRRRNHWALATSGASPAVILMNMELSFKGKASRVVREAPERKTAERCHPVYKLVLSDTSGLHGIALLAKKTRHVASGQLVQTQYVFHAYIHQSRLVFII